MMAVTHGVRSARYVDPLALELAEALLESRPDLHPHPHAVAAWARAEAKCLLLAKAIRERGDIDEKGNVRWGADVARFENLAAKHRQTLGLDPKAEAELMRARREAVEPGDVLRAILERGNATLAAQAAIAGAAASDG